MALNIAALLLSVLALGLSTMLAIRQYQEARVANQLPVVLNMFHGLRTETFHAHEGYVLQHLAKECPDELGYSQLTGKSRAAFQTVASFYTSLGMMIAFRLINKDLASALFGSRMLKAWDVMAPYVNQERKLRDSAPDSGDGVYGEYFEYFAETVRSHSPADVLRKQGLGKYLRAP